MRLTPRGRRVVVALTLVGATTLGVTAQHWDPYARHLESVPCVTGVHPDGTADVYCGDPAEIPPQTRVQP